MVGATSVAKKIIQTSQLQNVLPCPNPLVGHPGFQAVSIRIMNIKLRFPARILVGMTELRVLQLPQTQNILL
jgi:hypothetical protein